MLISLLLLVVPALAQPRDPGPALPRTTTTLVSEVAAIAPGQPFRVALDQVFARGWHSYWRNPGAAGAAIEITWEGAEAGPLLFPAPSRIPFGPLISFGYQNSATYLTTITPPAGLRAGDSLTLTAEARWLVCADICIPEEGRFTLTLPVEAAIRPGTNLDAAEAALPRPNPFPTRIGFEGMRGALRLDGLPGGVREAFFFPLSETLLDQAAPQPLRWEGDALTLGLSRGTAPLPASIEGVLTLIDNQGVRSAFEIAATPGPMPGGGGLPLWQAALFAALGGLILNLMPCVFPILAMKAMALVRLSGASRGAIRAEALGYTAGVVTGFLMIGGVLLGLRLAGSAAGWGFQFTQPAFVAGMAWLMLAVGLNLSGVFAVRGPVVAGGAGSFATGALAVLVATPCTAPFMAVALGAALAMPPAPMLLVFAAMGLGMALPYALLGLAPGLARGLPRPGPWMERLRQLLAFPMYAAAAWLVWVLAQLAGADGVALGLGGAVLVALAAWALGQGARWGRGMALGAALAALALLPGLRTAPAIAAGPHEAWSAARVETLRAEGRAVFVNVTAAWCISCQVNERLTLETSAVRDAFAAARVTSLVGDWTRGDPAISALLRQHQREGVPLYLLYPARGGPPVVLPQILTEGIVLRALREAM